MPMEIELAVAKYSRSLQGSTLTRWDQRPPKPHYTRGIRTCMRYKVFNHAHRVRCRGGTECSFGVVQWPEARPEGRSRTRPKQGRPFSTKTTRNSPKVHKLLTQHSLHSIKTQSMTSVPFPWWEYPSSSHTTCALLSLQLLSHKVFHWPETPMKVPLFLHLRCFHLTA